jgi:hypothetical protein
MIGGVPDIAAETGAQAMYALLALYGLCDQPETVAPRPLAIDIWAEADVCGWPDEGPCENPAIVTAWCAAVCRRNATMVSPPPPGAEVTPEENGADWLEKASRKHGVIPSGQYAAAILPRGMHPIATAKTSGVSFLVGIVGGAHDGTECRLSFLCEGPDAIVRRDLGLLQQWGSALGVGRSRDILNLVAKLGDAGKGRRVTLGIASRESRNGVELACVSVDVEGHRDG